MQDGYLTPEQARVVYGVVVDTGGAVDGEATRKVRARLAKGDETDGP